MKIEIKNRYTNGIIYSCEAESIKEAVERAVKEGVSLANANLSNANLANAYLENAYLANANLYNANLENANLENANLENANLHNANLYYANLVNANLYNAYLANANLENANLHNAYLYYANLYNANLENANLVKFQYQRHAALYVFDGMLRIGCLYMPLNEWQLGFKEIGKANNYTEEQIEAYGNFIDLCMKDFLKRTKK